jgi:hypothetical protein
MRLAASGALVAVKRRAVNRSAKKKETLYRSMYRQRAYFKYINVYAYVGKILQESENHRLCFCFSEFIPFCKKDFCSV